MSRTQIVLDSKNNQESSKIIDEILDYHKFEMVSKNDEDYWQQGIGVTQSPKYIKYYFDGDKLILEGWVSNFGKESDLGGVVGALPKKTCKKILNEITDAIEKSNKEQENNPSVVVENNKEVIKEDELSDNCEKTNMNLETLTDDLFNKIDGNQVSENKTASKNTKVTSQNSKNKNISNQKSTGSKGIIPRKYRGSILSNVFEILIAIFYIIGASSGHLVLRFTDSSEALIFVALIILIHGVLALISNLQDS